MKSMATPFVPMMVPELTIVECVPPPGLILLLVAPAAIPVPPETSPEFTTFTVAAVIPKERAPPPVATALTAPELFMLAG